MSHLRRELGMLIALLLLCGGLFLSNFNFVGFSNSSDTLRNISMLGIFSIGMAFVIITGGIDLSVGSLIGLAGTVMAKVSSHDDGCWGCSIYAGIAAALGLVLLMGLIQGLLITRMNLQPFIVTLAGMMIFRGMAQTIAEGGKISFGRIPFRHFANGGLFIQHGSALISWPVILFVVVALVFGYLLNFTVFGRYVYAIGGNRDAAQYSGINVGRIETLTYVISAGLAGVAAICYASFIGGMNQDVGRSYELYAIAGAVLGGCSLRGGEGSVFGVVIGVSIYQVIANGINMFQWPPDILTQLLRPQAVHHLWRLDTNWTDWIVGALILLAVGLDQLAHIIRARKRTRKAGSLPPTQVSPLSSESAQQNSAIS
jgi:ribose transport system permease protein